MEPQSGLNPQNIVLDVDGRRLDFSHLCLIHFFLGLCALHHEQSEMTQRRNAYERNLFFRPWWRPNILTWTGGNQE